MKKSDLDKSVKSALNSIGGLKVVNGALTVFAYNEEEATSAIHGIWKDSQLLSTIMYLKSLMQESDLVDIYYDDEPVELESDENKL